MTPVPFDREALRRELDERPFRQLSGDGGRRPHWADIEADERRDRMYGELPELRAETVSLGDWQDRAAERRYLEDEDDRTLTDELPPGYDPRCFG